MNDRSNEFTWYLKWFASAAILWIAAVQQPKASATDDFEREIAPLISKRCLECHNPRDAKGGLNLTTREDALKGGDSGPVIVPGKPQKSFLLQRVADGEMPPEVRGKPQSLPKREIALLEKWIADGARWPNRRSLSLYEKTTDVRAGLDWWSLQKVRRPIVPHVKQHDRIANPIDAFVLARLEQANLTPAPIADNRTLIRRAYFDLIGLPPTPNQIAAFVGDDSPTAYEELIDRLLDSKHYGERWARYWLDLVRFAETCGYERDQLKPNIWKYRDWVIRAFNEDVPYNDFVIDQLAGDEVSDRDQQSVIATGMLRAGTWNDEPNDPADYLYERLEDMVHTTTSAFLGLTVKCARCHDHKFDPIQQTDYYRTAGFFWAGYLGQENLGGPTKEQLGYDVFGWTDKGPQPAPIRLLIKGERHRPGPVVKPGFLSTIPALNRPVAPPPEGSKTTRGRLQLAKWIADPQNPLTARVLINRLWLYHFGHGIVRTPNNFGFKSEPPTHPKLLDWLAAEFVEGGWKIKRMHKLIMLSSTYRQSSQHPRGKEYADKDFLNRLWWRFPRRRLDAEALRDAMLAVSGQLNRKMGGPSFFPQMSDEALEGLSRKNAAWGQSSPGERSRRSVYMMTKRSRLLPLMTTFDFCDTTLPCGRRDVTTVAPQALALLNNDFVHQQSQALARRLMDEAGEDPIRQIERAWHLALGRPPSRDESAAAVAHLESQRKHFDIQREKNASKQENKPDQLALKTKNKLVLWLRADHGVRTDKQGRVRFWRSDASLPLEGLFPHDASQADPRARPMWKAHAIGDLPAVRFSGAKQWMHLAGQVIWSPQFTIFAVANDQGAKGPREIISNWHRRGRSVNSVFLGTSGAFSVRFTDDFAPEKHLSQPNQPFVLTAVSDNTQASVFQNRKLLGSGGKLSTRDLHAPYIIGAQGNHGGEWWQGDIAEILVYDRALRSRELDDVWSYLLQKYGFEEPPTPLAPRGLALASLCHVLLNTNEFIYVD